MQDLEEVLKNVFKLKSFREGQKEVVESVIERNDTLVFMPTWWGKSLTYQLPGVVMDGVAIIISPLISLMKDQIDKLDELWIKSRLINSTISQGEISDILIELQENRTNPIKFLYIAPERLHSSKFINIVKNLKISLVAIDEAHCISQWWHDFRTSYMKIKGFLDLLKGRDSFPIIGLTATATEKVRADIVDKLWLEEYNSFVKGFDRKNIVILVREISARKEKLEKVSEILDNTKWSWIIYCSSRKSVKEVYDYLCEKNVKAWMYTWELNAEVRESMQNKFMQDEYKVIVATNAFWMWIDKKDIRFVIHYNLPWSIENYYQEVWRAGRDWKISFWIVLASYGDTKIQEFFIENIYPSREEILKFYDYLYKDTKTGEWKETSVTKTYSTMSKESQIWSDMRVWSIIKILEKYWIIRRWIKFWEEIDNFRWRWITLIQEKRKHSNLLIDWNRQKLLEEEAYYKLDQIKKLLFYPSCRKKFILNYFWDKEDLKSLWNNCKVCDYCIEKKKIDSGKLENLVSLSVFEIVLEVIKKFDFKFWVKLISNYLRGSKDKRILEWWFDKKDDYGVLSEYSSELIEGLIEGLIKEEFIEKTSWKFPLIWLSDLWIIALKKEKVLKESEEELQSYLHLKVRSNAFRKTSSTNEKKENNNDKKTWNYDLTLKLFKEWLSLKEISKKMDFKIMTIENHVLKLYEKWDLWLNDILKLVKFDNLKESKNIINEFFWWKVDKLKPIKEKLEELCFNEISYFEIKMTLVMLEKKDL